MSDGLVVRDAPAALLTIRVQDPHPGEAQSAAKDEATELENALEHDPRIRMRSR